MPSRLIISAGLYGSGSTWMFNVIAMILRRADPAARIHRTYTDLFQDEEIPGHGSDVVLIKTHRPPSAVRLMTRLTATPTVLTVRDPRDAAVSLMTRFGLDFEGVMEDIRQSAAAVTPLADCPHVLCVRYEDRFTSRRETLDAVATRLGAVLTPADREAIWLTLTPTAVSSTIEALAAGGAFDDAPPAETFDHDTQWHPNHVGDGRVGKWRTLLTPEQASRVVSATEPFGERFGYSSASAARAGTGAARNAPTRV